MTRAHQGRTLCQAPVRLFDPLHGGVTQASAGALNEEYIYDKDGRLENPGFLDYRVPVAPGRADDRCGHG
jgi:hypothetical protein